MSTYNNQLTMDALFRNKKLNRVLPQFPKKTPLRNVYSGAEITSRVKRYLNGALGGFITGENEIRVKGRQADVLSRVRQLRGLIEVFFNNMPTLVKNMRGSTNLYTTFASAGQIEAIKGKEHIDEKISLMQDVLDNINFNPDFNALNSISKLSPAEFARAQERWCKKVGLKIGEVR